MTFRESRELKLRTHFAELGSRIRSLSQSKKRQIIDVSSYYSGNTAYWTIKYSENGKLCEYRQEIKFTDEEKV